MQTCPTCQTSNPAGASFCMNCGTKLARACTNCGVELPAAARFCMNCGQPVAAALAAAAPLDSARHAQLAAAAPAPLAEKMRAAHLEGERKFVTVLFADVVGSTALAERMDPEEWVAFMNRAFERMAPAIYRYEGTIARLMGDALVAFFGAPVTHEDDPVRAVRAALDLLEAAKEYAEEVRRTQNLDFAVRVGLNTGIVVVGDVGSDLKFEYTAMGDAVNLAARMQTAADPGSVIVAEATYRLAAPFFEFEDRGEIEVKGKSRPVRVHRVLASRTGVVQARGIEGLYSPLVGREAEIETLRAALRDLAAGPRGRPGRIVSVIAEAGLGKSRLIAELRKTPLVVSASPDSAGNDEDEIEWLEGRSLSYQTTTPYAPFVDMFSAFFRVRSDEDDETRYARIKSTLIEIMPNRADETAPAIASMLGIVPTGSDAERIAYLEPPFLRMRVFQAVIGLISTLAARRPLVLALEDLHWADPSSLELAEQLMRLTESVPLLLLALFRPRHNEPSWRFHEVAARDHAHAYTPLFLKPLDADQSRLLVANLLHIEDLPEQVRHLILAKAEGNPFYMEEVIRSLLDEGLVVNVDGHWKATRAIADIALPDTLVGVIAARLDRLGESVRQVAQAASVVGREFAFEVLSDVLSNVLAEENSASSAAETAVEDALVALQQRELVREKSRFPRRVYTFKHVLTQEAAYNSVLLSRRRELHRRAAESLQRHDPEAAPAIAHHFLEARQPGRAVPYLIAAGDHAARAYSNAEAIGFYRKAVELRAAVESMELVQRAYEGLGGVLTLTNQVEDALQTYREMLALGENEGYVAMQIAALTKMGGVVGLNMGDFAESDKLLDRAKALSEAHDERSSVVEGAIIRCQTCTARADFPSVIASMDNVIRLSRATGHNETVAMSLSHISTSLVYLTRFDEAFEKAQEGLAIAREAGDRLHECDFLCVGIPFSYMSMGRFDEARAALEEGVAIAHRIGAIFPQVYGEWTLAELARWQGDYEGAIEHGQISLDIALPVEGFMPFMTVQPLGALGMTYIELGAHFRDRASEYHLHALRLLENPVATVGGGTAWADLGWCLLALGDLDKAEAVIEKGLHHPTIFMQLERPRYLAAAAAIALARSDSEQALALVEQAQQTAEERSLCWQIPLVQFTAGRVRAQRAEHEQALAAFERAEHHARPLDMLPLIWQTQAERARVLDAVGRTEEASQQRSQALAVVDEIGAKLRDETLRSGYLAEAHARIH